MEREAARERERQYAGRPKKGEKFTPISDGQKALDKVARAVGMSRPTLEPLEREAARERQGERTDQHPVNFAGSWGKALDKVARAVGMSRPTLEPLEREAARERQAAQDYGRGTTLEKFSEVETGRALDKVATQLAGRNEGGEPIFGGEKVAPPNEKGKALDKVARATHAHTGNSRPETACR